MKVPKKVLDKLPSEMVNRIEQEHQDPVRAKRDYIVNLELTDTNIKERTRKILWEIYNNEGYSRFCSLVQQMKSFKNYDFNDIIQVKGETAEVVLEIIVHQFIKEHKLDWSVYKGLIVPLNTGDKGTTELDLILVTPVVVSIIEIKSYNGDKVLSGDCYLEANNSGYKTEKNIYSQNCLHIRAFWDNFNQYALSETGLIKSVMFSFAKGTLQDNRSLDKKEIMPVYDEITIPSYLEALRQLQSKPRWEVSSLNAAIQKVQENSISLDEHIAYLNSKYGK